jgi:hypothetical protein
LLSFAQFEREVIGERVRDGRFLLPLAFASPKLIHEIVDRQVPAQLALMSLAGGLSWIWTEQEKKRSHLDAEERQKGSVPFNARLRGEAPVARFPVGSL